MKNGGGTFIVNLNAPGGGRTTTHESLAGALGIPEFMPPSAADFHSKQYTIFSVRLKGSVNKIAFS